MLLWLKLGGLAGLRAVSHQAYRPVYLALATAAGAILGLVGQFIWGFVGARVLSSHAPTRDMRLVWGASALPLSAVLLVLLPLDLLIAGPETFTTERMEDPLATTWAAFSMAAGVVLILWTAHLFVRGLKVIAGEPGWRVRAAALSGLLVLCAVFAPLLLGARLT
jgi:hypothetical protein